MAKLKNLDENGIVRIGSIVKGGDILVGKISPKSEGELSAEEKLIQAVFGEKSKNVKDSSLYLPSGSEGKVLDVVVLDSKKGDNLMAGVKNKITIFVATSRKIEVGDKLVGRHGNKGIISVILPEEDMPYTADGKPVDIILNPLGVVSRMNIGQVLENHMGLIAKLTGYNFAIPLFSGFGVDDVRNYYTGNLTDTDINNLKKSGLNDTQINQIISTIKDAKLPDNGKFDMFDGRNGDRFDQTVSVGYMYILKLEHMVEDKIHARSVGPYSLITQQPLSGKARDGGQRFGEMEVWALEAYGAVHTLQEMLTIKSDDIAGRNKTYESIIKGKKIQMY
jgi:DNA-directed RNA polymerase subunit beta